MSWNEELWISAVVLGGGGPESLVTAVSHQPTAPAPDDGQIWSAGDMMTGKGSD
jgi:hypothetical protein